jgi:hypothetical protein
MTQPIRDRQHRAAVLVDDEAPVVAALDFASLCGAHDADLERTTAAILHAARFDARDEHRASSADREDVESRREPRESAKSGAGAAGGGVAIVQRTIEVGDTRSVVDRDELRASHIRHLDRPQYDLTAPRMLRDVRGGLGREEGELPRIGLTQAGLSRDGRRTSTRFTDLAGLVDCDSESGRVVGTHRTVHFHRVITTRVPSPTVELMSNSFTSRFAPPSPSPSPLPVV